MIFKIHKEFIIFHPQYTQQRISAFLSTAGCESLS